MIPGQGVSAVVGGRRIAAGNLRFMEVCGAWDAEGRPAIAEDKDQKKQPDESCPEQGATVIYLSVDGRAAGFLALSDTLREDAGQMVEKIKEMGITPVLLTGDRPESAGLIAKQVKIEEVHAKCLPQDKLDIIDFYIQNREMVCMVGDGVNDAPALKKAHVGIAMGGIGSDIAIEAADIALIRDDILAIPHTAALSRRMMTTIKRNMAFSMGINLLAVVLAMTGYLSPVAGALVHNGGSVLVIINSAFLMKWRKKD